MRLNFIGLAAAAIMFAAPACLAEESTPVAVTGIRVMLFYEYSGRFSPDIAPPADVSLWNTVIGEGSAEEPASDYVVIVDLAGPQGAYIEKPVLTIAVKSKGDGKVLAQREASGLLFNVEGKASRVLFVTEATCIPAAITAIAGKSRKTIDMEFNCGE